MRFNTAVSLGMEKIVPPRDNERRLTADEQQIAYSGALLWPFQEFPDTSVAKRYVLTRLNLRRQNAHLHPSGVQADVIATVDAQQAFVRDDVAVARATRIGKIANRIESFAYTSAAVIAAGALVLGAQSLHNTLEGETVTPENNDFEISCEMSPETTVTPGPQHDVLRNQHFNAELQCRPPRAEANGGHPR